MHINDFLESGDIKERLGTHYPHIFSFQLDEAYLEAAIPLIASLRSTQATIPSEMAPTLIRIEEDALKEVESPQSPLGAIALRNLGRIAAIRESGFVLSETKED